MVDQWSEGTGGFPFPMGVGAPVCPPGSNSRGYSIFVEHLLLRRGWRIDCFRIVGEHRR